MLDNLFFKVIIVPSLLTVATALLEVTVTLANGLGSTEGTYVAWLKKSRNDGTEYIARITDQKLDDIRWNRRVTAVEPMGQPDVSQLDNLGINLVIGAFAVDIASLFNNGTDPVATGYVLVSHLLIMVGVILFSILSQLTLPTDRAKRGKYVGISIGLGLFAMMIAFLTL